MERRRAHQRLGLAVASLLLFAVLSLGQHGEWQVQDAYHQEHANHGEQDTSEGHTPSHYQTEGQQAQAWDSTLGQSEHQGVAYDTLGQQQLTSQAPEPSAPAHDLGSGASLLDLQLGPSPERQVDIGSTHDSAPHAAGTAQLEASESDQWYEEYEQQQRRGGAPELHYEQHFDDLPGTEIFFDPHYVEEDHLKDMRYGEVRQKVVDGEVLYYAAYGEDYEQEVAAAAAAAAAAPQTTGAGTAAVPQAGGEDGVSVGAGGEATGVGLSAQDEVPSSFLDEAERELHTLGAEHDSPAQQPEAQAVEQQPPQQQQHQYQHQQETAGDQVDELQQHYLFQQQLRYQEGQVHSEPSHWEQQQQQQQQLEQHQAQQASDGQPQGSAWGECSGLGGSCANPAAATEPYGLESSTAAGSDDTWTQPPEEHQPQGLYDQQTHDQEQLDYQQQNQYLHHEQHQRLAELHGQHVELEVGRAHEAGAARAGERDGQQAGAGAEQQAAAEAIPHQEAQQMEWVTHVDTFDVVPQQAHAEWGQDQAAAVAHEAAVQEHQGALGGQDIRTAPYPQQVHTEWGQADDTATRAALEQQGQYLLEDPQQANAEWGSEQGQQQQAWEQGQVQAQLQVDPPVEQWQELARQALEVQQEPGVGGTHQQSVGDHGQAGWEQAAAGAAALDGVAGGAASAPDTPEAHGYGSEHQQHAEQPAYEQQQPQQQEMQQQEQQQLVPGEPQQLEVQQEEPQEQGRQQQEPQLLIQDGQQYAEPQLQQHQEQGGEQLHGGDPALHQAAEQQGAAGNAVGSTGAGHEMAMSDTDAMRNAFSEAAAAAASEAAEDSDATAVAAAAAAAAEDPHAVPHVAVEAQAPAPSPLGNMTTEEVKNRFLDATDLLFANPAARDRPEGLRQLQELSRLVEQALAAAAQTERVRMAPPPTAEELQQREAELQRAEDGAEGGALAQRAQLPPPKPRSLASEITMSRQHGLHAAASATFTLAALEASGVAPPELGGHDPLRALVRLHAAARGGSLEALLALADRHAQGAGVDADCPRAMTFARLAGMYLAQDVDAEQRYAPPLAPVQLRERHADRGYVEAEDAENGADVVSLEEDMALRGNADAQRRMAYRRLVGRGIEADPEGAFHDFQAAAAQGDPYAIFNVGYMHLRGLFVPQNYTAAREQFELAAEKGLPSAHNGLGVLAWNGQGVAQNLTAAREHFERGAALNNSDSLYNLATMHYHGAGTPINYTLGVELFTRAHEHGHWRAPYMLALAYDAGQGVTANCTKAMSYMRIFFSERSTWGDTMTAAVKQLDAGDPWGALLSYITVAEQGSAAAAVNAAWLLRRRVGYRGDNADQLAAKYFQRAARMGHTGSMVELAHLLLAAAPPPPPPGPTPTAQEAGDQEEPQAGTTPPDNPSSDPLASGDKEEDAVQASEAVPAAAHEASASPAAAAPGDAAADMVANPDTRAESAEATESVRAAGRTDNTAEADITASAGSESTTQGETGSAAGVEGGDADAAANGGRSSSSPPAPPPLVPPADVPKTRAVLGRSTQADALAWYAAAAAAGDPEGVFYLAWCTYHGVGAKANVSYARALYIRSFELAGIRSPRALAPLLALAGIRIDAWLAPYVGPYALSRLHAVLVEQHAFGKQWLEQTPLWKTVQGMLRQQEQEQERRRGGGGTSGVQGAGGAGGGGGSGGSTDSWRKWSATDVSDTALRLAREVVSWAFAQGPVLTKAVGSLAKVLQQGTEEENVVMGALLVALLVVLVVRRRRMAGRTP